MRATHILAGVTFALGGTTAVFAEPPGCTPITSAPFTISTSGLYCLVTDLNLALATGHAIGIEASNVTLDLGGHKIGNLSAGLDNTAHGIDAYARNNITIRNGTLRGFIDGIDLGDATPITTSGHLIESIRFDRITNRAITVASHGSVIRNCLMVDTGGSPIFGPDTAGEVIFVVGRGNRIIDNDIVTVVRRGAASGTAILLTEAPDSLVVNNRITDSGLGVYFAGSSTGKYRDNLTSNVSRPFVGGTDAGNNN